jgi:FtsP/CotA-like multicopper oxidase with cupredoxin domain
MAGGRPQNKARIAFRNRQEIIQARLTRRDLMKMGLLTSTGYLVAKQGLSARASGGRVPSPPTRSFVVPLPIPPVARPEELDPAPAGDPVAGEAPRARHQGWSKYPPGKSYRIAQEVMQVTCHPDLPPSTMFACNSTVPGPTIRARYDEPVVVRFQNDLPPGFIGFGVPQTSTHLHNGHTPSESDGFPGDFFNSGFFKDHHYPNICAGGDSREALGTLWYHDHRVDFTSQNVYRGLAGFYLLFDEVDSGDETDPNPAALRLPSGEYDIPLIVQDRLFDEDGQLAFDLFNFDGILGDKFLVNGAIQPYLNVARRKYRFRLLDGGPSRFYEFFLSSGRPFTLIAQDGNLLPAPMTVGSVRIGVAERSDVIIDFSSYDIGDQIFLENRLEQQDGRGPTGKIVNPGMPILRFDVDRDAPDPSRVPELLRPLPMIDMNDVVTTRTWRFERQNGAWAVNGKFFDVEQPRATPRQGTAEVWALQNSSGGWSHPIHIHFEEFQILSRNGRRPPAAERGRKDVIRLGPNDEVRLFLRFRDFLGRHVMHCHNTLHEDHAMMLRWDVVP